MSARSQGGSGSPYRNNDGVTEDPTAPSTSGGDSSKASLADDDKPVETRFSDDINESRVMKLENVESGIGDAGEGESQAKSSISRGQDKDLTTTGVGNAKFEHEKVQSSIDDYDSILSEFDQFAAKGMSEAVGYGYEIGDMVWGKVKSHPWWPGHIYNEAFASPTVQRSKREGHVLVAFFGDGSYGWFDPAELVPFEENFVEKSRQTSSRAFIKAVEEALDELSRRRSLGLACRCRNEFNFWPSSIKGYFVVDVGDYEPVVYSASQIKKSREKFHPNEMLYFVQQLALSPMTDQHWTLEFIKNKATVLACRKALYEEFDETYAQAFGTVPLRPPRPTAPVAVDPLKAPLSGRLVFAEAIGKQRIAMKPTKSKDQMEKEKYLFKRREEPIHMKTKKTGPPQIGGLLLVDGTPSGPVMKGMHKSFVDQASMFSDIKRSEGSVKLVGKKRSKLQKQGAVGSSSENATLVVKKRRKKEIITGENVIVVDKMKKREKEIRSEASADMAKLPLASSNSEASAEKVPVLDVPFASANNQLDSQKNDDFVASSSSSEAKEAADIGKSELLVLVNDLQTLAIDPFHGVARSCQAATQLMFLKYRSLVFQKSLVSSPQTEIEMSESMHVPPEKTNDKSTMKPMRPLIRRDDPTIGGKKRGPSNHPEPIKKKKKLEDSDDISTRKKLLESEGVKIKKKKILNDSKSSSLEKKVPPRSTESPSLPNVVKLEPNKRTEQPRKARNPTMLVMKFPPGASLPSGAHLRAKFARFGPLDHAATRVFWKTYTCRLVFMHKVDAEDALKFARESGDLFGSTTVRSYIREVGAEAVESEPIKAQREDTSAAGAPQWRDASVEQRTPVKITVQPHQQLVQLKSCLKKPSGEEVGSGTNGRGTSRVKFVLGGEEQNSNYNEGASSYTHSMDVTSKNMPKFIPPLPSQKLPSNRPSVVQETPNVEPKNDISQQLLNLLARCNDVVNNLSGVLGYVPYHQL